MGLAGLGAIGNVLSDASLGFLKGWTGPSWDEEKAARERKAREEEADIRLKEAHALYYGRPTKPTGGVPDVLETTWGVYVKDPVTGKLRLEHSKPPEDPREVDPAKAFGNTVLGAIERKLGKPQGEWSDADLLRPDIRPLVDLIQKRSDIVVTPGWGPLSAEDIRDALRRKRQAAPPTNVAPTSDQPPPAAETPPQQPRDRTEAAPAVPRAPVPRPAAPPPPRPAAPSSTTRGQAQRDLLPMVAGYEKDYTGWSESDLQRELEQVSTAEADAPSPVNKAKLTALGRVLAGRRRPPQTRPAPAAPQPAPAVPGRQSLLEEEPALSPYIATYAKTMEAITPAGAMQLVSDLTQAAPGSPFARAASQAYAQVHGQPQTDAPLEDLTQQPGFAETDVQPQDPWSRPTPSVTRVAQTGTGTIPSLGVPPGQEDKREAQTRERADLAHRLARELYGKDLGALTQPEMATLNRTLERREAQGKTRFEDELDNQRALQDVRQTDYDRFFFRGTGQPVPGTMPYGVVKALQDDPKLETSVVHLTTDNAKQLSTLKLLEPVLKQYSDLIEYAYGPGGPLESYTREPLPILSAMVNQFSQSDPVLQAKRRAVEGQLQSLVRALGSRGDLNAQELDMATNLIANLDASVGLNFSAGIGYGRGGVGPMIGFKPSISVPDSPRVGVQLANELIGQVNQRIAVLLQAPDYAGTPRITVPAARRGASLYGVPSAEKLEERVNVEFGERLKELRQNQQTAPGWRWPWESLDAPR